MQMSDWEKRFDVQFPQGALDDMQRAYIRNIKEFVQDLLDEQEKQLRSEN